VAQPVQVNGGGWIVDKPMGGREEHPKPNKSS